MVKKQNGKLVIISSPSGGGKDSVIKALLKIFPNSTRLITTTSRAPRPDQKEGVDYYFISPQEFQKKIEDGKFVEYNFYAGNFYGTEKKILEESLKNKDLVLTQIEVNGKHNFDKAKIPHLSIFLLPENLKFLKKRIKNRGGIPEELIKKRLEIAKEEIKQSNDYDEKIINYEGKLEETIKKVTKTIRNYLK